MTGSCPGLALQVACVFMFLAGLTSLLVTLTQTRPSRDDIGDASRRRLVRSLEKLHPDDVNSLYRDGIFSALVNASVENNGSNEALLILLPALEKFENVMVEESRKIRTALKDHDKRIKYLEDFISRQNDEDVQNTQGIQPNKIEQRKARIKVTKSKAQNEVLKTPKKRKEIIKEVLKKPPVDVQVVKNETIRRVVQNDTDVKPFKKVKTVHILKETVPQNETLLTSDAVDNILLSNETDMFYDTLMSNDSVVHNESVTQNTTQVQQDDETMLNEEFLKDFSLVLNETEIYLDNNSTDVIVGNSSLVNISLEIDNSTSVENTTIPVSSSQELLENLDNTTMNIFNTSSVSPLTVTMTTLSTIPPTTTPRPDRRTLEETVSELQIKVSQLEKLKSKSGRGKSHNYKRKIKILEKNLVEIKKRYRKMKTRLNSQNSKISGLAILQNVAYSDMPHNMRQEYEAKKATILRFDRIERKLTNYRDMVIRNRHEIRDLKGLTSKHEHYISELQAGSDRFEHKGRELTAGIHGVEANIGNLFNSLNGYMSDIRWEVRVMLDRVCGDNRLHC